MLKNVDWRLGGPTFSTFFWLTLYVCTEHEKQIKERKMNFVNIAEKHLCWRIFK